MSYTGSVVPIPIARAGLLTDISPDEIPPQNLIKANNVTIDKGVLEKAPGSLQWSATALPAGIVALYDYWPVPGKQYTIAVTREGRVYRYLDRFTVVEIVPDTRFVSTSGAPPATLSVTERVCIVEGGKEFVGVNGSTQPAKLFIMTGNSPIQVIYGEETTRHNLLVPAADWNGQTGKKSYPDFGVIYLSRLWVFGNRNAPHYAYVSSNTVGGTPTYQYGHEDFSETTFNSAFFNIYPGDNERLISAFKYKTKFWMLKYPRGLYSLEIPDVGTPASWYFQKVNDDVGAATQLATAPVLDDTWVINSTGTIQSLSATLNLGGVESTNILNTMMIENYVQDLTSPLGIGERQAIWHEKGSTVYFLYRKKNSQLNSFLLRFDFTSANPKVTIVTKDQANILAIRRDVSQVEQIIYGSEDGFIYQMNNATRSNGPFGAGAGYIGEFQTPNLNLGADSDKNFDFVEIEYIPTGNVKLYCDVYIDGNRTQTIDFTLNKSNQLNQFILNKSRLQGRSTRRQRKSVSGRGRTISVRFYNSGNNENFRVTGLTISARISGVDAKGSLGSGTTDNK